MVIPSDPKLQVVQGKDGSWFNFVATTQGRTLKDKEGPNWNYWDCSMFVPSHAHDTWSKRILPGQVFQVELGEVVSTPIMDGKYHKTKIKLDIYRVKHLATPMWVKSNEKKSENKTDSS